MKILGMCEYSYDIQGKGSWRWRNGHEKNHPLYLTSTFYSSSLCNMDLSGKLSCQIFSAILRLPSLIQYSSCKTSGV